MLILNHKIDNLKNQMTIPKIILKKNRDIPFIEKHPWVFSGAIDRLEGTINDGDEVGVFSSKSQFIAWGLYNSKSQIRVRLYSWDENVLITDNFIKDKIADAVNFRKSLNLIRPDSAVRLIFSEGDFLSGLTVDYYSGYLLIQITSLALYNKIEIIKEQLIKLLNPKGIYLRTEKGIGETEGLVIKDSLLFGNEPLDTIKIIENDLTFEVDLRTGQKTGFYIDQKENRKAIRQYIKDKRVLDLCCYSGAFSVNAGVYGAKEVLGVDISSEALKLAHNNAQLNNLTNVTFQKSDAFKFLSDSIQNKVKYDVIILDPPKFSHSKSSSSNALKGYIQLNQGALSCLNPGGILITCSCSGRITMEDFISCIRRASLLSDKSVRIVESRGQSHDHPVSIHCPESNYLKCIICQVT